MKKMMNKSFTVTTTSMYRTRVLENMQGLNTVLTFTEKALKRLSQLAKSYSKDNKMNFL